MKTLLERLAQPKPLMADGAMGTLLHGKHPVACLDLLNLTQPDLVSDIHRQYIEAGAQVVLANTFGANRFKLGNHGLEGKMEEINQAGINLVRSQAARSNGEIFVAGDVGPLGVRLSPYGRVQRPEAHSAFREQIGFLAEAGADLIVIETMTDLVETLEAVSAARSVCDLPVAACMTFTRDDLTLLGDAPAKVARDLQAAGVDIVGVNCSGGPAQLARILRQMRQALEVGPQDKIPHLWVKPNAGWPENIGGRVLYAAGPEYFADFALDFWKFGAKVIGGCCGTTPEHIAAMRRNLDAHPSTTIESLATIATKNDENMIPAEPPSQLAQDLAGGKFVLAVEMDPPRGLVTKKLVAAASLLKEAGASVIDVADSPMARMRMSAWAVCDTIQHKVAIETTLHFPTRGRNLLRVQGDLLAAHALGIRNLFVVMGDPTAIGDYPEAMDDYDLVPSGLIRLVKQGFNCGKDHAGTSIGQATSYFVGAALNLSTPEPETEIRNLKRKMEAGADFFITQPVFDPHAAQNFLEKAAAKVPSLPIRSILVGVMPLASLRHASFLQNEVPGIVIPTGTMERLEKAGADAGREGSNLAVELITGIKEWAGGVYIMPQFHRYDLVAEIIEAVK